MKIATMATGGIGGYLAVKLTQAGHQVATIARGAHLDAIRDRGLTLETADGSETVTPWIATDDPGQVGPVDAIIFGVKGDGLEAAAKACLPMIGPDTIVLPFLNGVEASDRLIAILPQANVGNGVAQVSTTIAGPGLIRQTGGSGQFLFAERDSRPSARVDALRAAINESGAAAPVTTDIVRDLWLKFIMFSAFSGVTAAARCTAADIRTYPPLGQLFRDVMAETAAIGRARAVDLPNDIVDKIWERVKKFPDSMRASTALDLEKGLPLEIEWVSGAAVRLARESGLPAPCNAAIYALLQPHRNGRPA
ncbi:ketopantoate reductase family protein [Chachezhania sediminis]|uniref:ketopantoate reductase family protein n=1 Tax=Chachezhania sediminis TaxID=2599291 RepID=UPI00131EA1C3|nr:2-dehydropantoate 2-reductase [Chachezhania sediminis]